MWCLRRSKCCSEGAPIQFQRCSEWLTCYLVVAMVSWVVVKILLKGKLLLECSGYLCCGCYVYGSCWA